jgi:hypothetical protein
LQATTFARSYSLLSVDTTHSRNAQENESHNSLRAARHPPALNTMPSKSPSGAAKRNHKKLRAALAIDTRQSSPQEAITGLPNHLVVTHILRSDYFDDPADLARLTAVSHAMRDAVTATGLRFQELNENTAAYLGCLSALHRWQRRGRLSRQELLCEAAANVGNLEELKVLRADGWPWDERTCQRAAEGGHLEVLR